MALTAILLVAFMIYIVDRSSEHVNEIKNTKVPGPGDNLASPLGAEDDLISMIVTGENSPHPSCTVTDGTIKAPMFHKIAQIKNLRMLSLKRCDFTGADFQILGNTGIEAIRFDNDKLDEECLKAIAKLPLIHLVEIVSCDLAPHALAHLSDSNVRWLQLRYSQNTPPDTNFSADDVHALCELKKICFLELEKCKFAPGAFSALRKSGAVALNVERCDLSDDDVIEIAKMPKLGYLNLARNPKVTCEGLRALLNSKTIQQISFTEDISKCSFTATEKKKLDPKNFQVPGYLWQKFNKE